MAPCKLEHDGAIRRNSLVSVAILAPFCRHDACVPLTVHQRSGLKGCGGSSPAGGKVKAMHICMWMPMHRFAYALAANCKWTQYKESTAGSLNLSSNGQDAGPPSQRLGFEAQLRGIEPGSLAWRTRILTIGVQICCVPMVRILILQVNDRV